MAMCLSLNHNLKAIEGIDNNRTWWPTDKWDGGFLVGEIQVQTSTELLFWAGEFFMLGSPRGPPCPVAASVPP